MKYADDPSFPQWLVSHPQLANKLAENKYIGRSIEYMLDVGYHNYEDLVVAFEKSSEELKQTMLTTRQQIEKRGIQTERIQIARNMFSKLHLDVDAVHKATGLSKQELGKLVREIGLN